TLYAVGYGGYSWLSTVTGGSGCFWGFGCDIFLARQARLECPAAPLTPGMGRGPSEAPQPNLTDANFLDENRVQAARTVYQPDGRESHPQQTDI
ncbi:MAG: hypothetical protein K2G93_05885, partial [Rikenella sp.]|nr:hypothetical protein [Rikenella sp.]